MFEKASKLKLRFATAKGTATTEDLWDLNLDDLDKVAISLDEQINSTGKSFIKTKTTANTTLDLKFEIVKHVIDVKQTEADERKIAKEKAAKRAKIMELMNQKESLNFSPKFYAFAFVILHRKTLFGFQDIDLINKNYFLVSNKYATLFDFNAYFDDLTQRTSERIDLTYSFDFDEYLKRYKLQTLQPENLERLKYICKKIAVLEFELPIDKNQLIFGRNTLIKLSEYITDILVAAGKPMRLVDIARELRIRSPKMPPNLESLRSTILSIPDVSAIGKTSTYSLDQWNNVKTGTIKEIVREYLEKHSKPMHITDITEYVVQFRKTSDKNIYSNLKLDKNKSFMFFKKGFIGLSNKTYGHQDKNGQLSMQ